jgi:hypothetical protein
MMAWDAFSGMHNGDRPCMMLGSWEVFLLLFAECYHLNEYVEGLIIMQASDILFLGIQLFAQSTDA